MSPPSRYTDANGIMRCTFCEGRGCEECGIVAASAELTPALFAFLIEEGQRLRETFDEACRREERLPAATRALRQNELCRRTGVAPLEAAEALAQSRWDVGMAMEWLRRNTRMR